MKETLLEELRRAAEAVAGAHRVAVTCHVSPDGDAIGSALALALATRREGKDTVVSFGEPFELPGSFGFLPVDLLSPPEDFPPEPEVMVVFDAGSCDRLGSLAASARKARTLIVVDHHGTNDHFGHINLVDPAAGASAQLGYYLLRELGWPIDGTIASCLWVGIVTDTGRFQYASTSPELLRVAADLLSSGVRPDLIGQQIYENVPFGYLQVSSKVLGRAVFEPDLRMVWSTVLMEDLAEAQVKYADMDGLIDDLRIAREAEVAVLLKEVDDGTKVSLRSRGEVDVAALALELGGGGHPRAAGFTYQGLPDEAIGAVRERLTGD